MKKFRRIAACVAILFATLGYITSAAAPASAAATMFGPAVTCGFPPPAPNAVDTCSGWVASSQAGWSYKVDITHHYGWWGSNFDPGTYHIITYLYNNGQLVGIQSNLDVGDHTTPWVESHGVWAYSSVDLFPHPQKSFQTGATNYRNCVPGGSPVQWVWLADTAYNQWAAANHWPHGQVSGGAICQHGFGSRTAQTHVVNGADFARIHLL